MLSISADEDLGMLGNSRGEHFRSGVWQSLVEVGAGGSGAQSQHYRYVSSIVLGRPSPTLPEHPIW